MKTIGLIGGTSWHSTMVYYQLINQKVQDITGTNSNPPLIIYSQNIELMRGRNFNLIKETYLTTSIKLIEFGAEAIVICANTPHLVYDYVQPKISVPIIHIGEAIGRKAVKNNLRKLGLLGNKPTMKMGFIQNYLHDKFGLEVIIPENKFIDTCNLIISNELTRGIFSDESKTFFLNQINLLLEAGADGIILGCTELPILINKNDTSVPLIDTTESHAQLASEFIMN